MLRVCEREKRERWSIYLKQNTPNRPSVYHLFSLPYNFYVSKSAITTASLKRGTRQQHRWHAGTAFRLLTTTRSLLSPGFRGGVGGWTFLDLLPLQLCNFSPLPSVQCTKFSVYNRSHSLPVFTRWPNKLSGTGVWNEASPARVCYTWANELSESSAASTLESV